MPLTAGAVGLGLMLAGNTLQYLEQTRTLRANASNLDQQAALVLELGQFKAGRIRDAGDRRAGDMRAQAAAAGLELSGSPLAVVVDHAIETEKDARAVLWEAELTATQLRSKAGEMRRAAKRSGLGFALGVTGAGVMGAHQLGAFNGQEG